MRHTYRLRHALPFGSVAIALTLTALASTAAGSAASSPSHAKTAASRSPKWPARSYPRETFFVNKKKIKILLILPSKDPYFAALYKGAVIEAKKWNKFSHNNDISIQFQHTASFSNADETAILNAGVAAHVNVVHVIPTSDGMAQPFREAEKAGVGVLVVDTPLSDSSVPFAQIFSDNYGGGYKAGKLLCAAVGGSGKVFEMSLRPGLNAPDLRLKGVSDYLSAHCKGVTDLGAQYNNFDPSRAAAETSAVLQANPDLKGIFTATDGDYSGVVSALQSANKSGKVKVVAYDEDPEQVPLLKNGTFSALVVQQPALEEEIAVDYSVEWMNGRRTFKSPIITPQIVVTKTNVDKYPNLPYTGP